MSDNKRRRFRKNKQPEEKRPIILAKRNVEEDTSKKLPTENAEVQPKILLKPKNDRECKDDVDTCSSSSVQMPLKTIIVTRSEATQSPNITKEQTSSNATDAAQAAPQIDEPRFQMTRPATVISSTGLINVSARRKFLIKNNSDFFVVGVIGAQGVGKSTIMNLLANEDPNYDYYMKVFQQEDSIFLTNLKPRKCRSRTESTHMYITSDRMILLDSPPVLCNLYSKDMTTNELDDLRNIITFMSVCHLLIVVQDDYCNMNFMRLLQFAELMKPTHDNGPFVNDYFPNVLFVKNRAKRQDYMASQKVQMDRMLKVFFKDSQLRVFLGQTTEQQRQKKTRSSDAERVVNTFLLPEVQGPEGSTYHKPLGDIIEDLRSIVFMTPRNEMYAGPAEFSEDIWFELLTKVTQDTQQFFFKTYEEIHRKHLEVGSSSGGGGNAGGGGNNANTKDLHDWKD